MFADQFKDLATITREVGSRFSQKSRNASRILFFWTEIEDFAMRHCPEIYNFYQHRNIIYIKEEIVAISMIWYSLLCSLWVELAKATVPVGMKLILGKFSCLIDKLIIKTYKYKKLNLKHMKLYK